MIRLNQKQINDKVKWLENYIDPTKNASDSTKIDANANVANKNVATASADFHKDINIQISRKIISDQIEKLFPGKGLGEEYNRQLEEHDIYKHDEQHSSTYPYTYGPDESVTVYLKNTPILTSFQDLYDLIEEDEVLLDEEKGVWGKFPKNLEIDDINGRTKITRLIKKIRHRDLVRVKTLVGEDLIVTDNHPLIIGESVDDTIDANSSLGQKQFSFSLSIKAKGNKEVDITEFIDNVQDMGSFSVSRIGSNNLEYLNGKFDLNAKLGYVVGFYIAEGWKDKNFAEITQSDYNTLQTIAGYLKETTGIGSYIIKDRCPSHLSRKTKYMLRINSPAFVEFISTFLKIKDYSSRKNLPVNLWETNDEFIGGIVAGIIDGDGSVSADKKTVSIRLASRQIVSQLTTVLRSYNYPVYNSYQYYPETRGIVCSNYPTFGVVIDKSGDLDLSLSYKMSKVIERNGNSRYKEGWKTISSVQKIESEKYLKTCIYDITTESQEFICNNLRVHNCTAIDSTPFLYNGLTGLGGDSKAPQHLSSYCGSYVNLIFAVASQFAGAVADVSMLRDFHFFAKKDYGEDYLETSKDIIVKHFEQIIYTINMPAATRGYQSIFYNTSVFDEFYFKGLYEYSFYPDGTKVIEEWEGINKLQKFFLAWFRKEREKALLTFPVITGALKLNEDGSIASEDWKNTIAEEFSKGHSFFVYMDKDVSSLSSCCRLKNDISDQLGEKNEFSYSLGAGGVSTGSLSVMTLNVNRFIQDNTSNWREALKEQVGKMHKFQLGFRVWMQKLLESKQLSVYEAGYITMDKQYLTIGINGLVEASEFLGHNIDYNKKYVDFVSEFLDIISKENKKASREYSEMLGYKVMFNTEFVPAENLGVKFYDWDKKAGYKVPDGRNLYNSYFYAVEDHKISILDKIRLHGEDTIQYLDGGSALHLNLGEHLTKEGFLNLLNTTAKAGANYWTYNVLNTICEEEHCGAIDPRNLDKCPHCHSINISHATRVIGYLRKVDSFSKPRREEAGKRVYHVEG